MPRKARELSPLEVRRVSRPGRVGVGGVDGLALKVKKSGTRSWVLRIAVAGRCREMGLGSFPSVTLAEAREKARLHRAQVIEGSDPIAARVAVASAAAAVHQPNECGFSPALASACEAPSTYASMAACDALISCQTLSTPFRRFQRCCKPSNPRPSLPGPPSVPSMSRAGFCVLTAAIPSARTLQIQPRIRAR